MQTKALLVSNDLASMHIYTYNKYKPMYQHIDNERTALHLIILYSVIQIPYPRNISVCSLKHNTSDIQFCKKTAYCW